LLAGFSSYSSIPNCHYTSNAAFVRGESAFRVVRLEFVETVVAAKKTGLRD
jgi:hypothetical protein